jgi:hypothetical protein
MRLPILFNAGFLILLAMPCMAATKILVTVVEQKTGKPVADLKAADFSVIDGESPRRVESAEYATGNVDTLLLVDASLVGGMVQPVAGELIAQLAEKEQMGLVAYHSAADLVQDFTSSKDHLRRALSEIKYGNEPRVLDALFAAADGGFQSTVLRRAVLLLTTGVEGYSRVSEDSVVRLAKRNGISIYTLYMSGQERGLFENLARRTGGAALSLRELGKAKQNVGERVFEVMRGSYAVMLAGNLGVGEKLKVEVRRAGVKLFVSALPVD